MICIGVDTVTYRRRLHRKEKKQRVLMGSLFIILLFFSLGYAAFSTNVNMNVKGNLKDKSRVIQRYVENSNENFHTDFYKENIVSATFLDSGIVPNDAVEAWDVSETKDKGVMAYVTESNTEKGKYDLYIGAKKGVVANPYSCYLFYNFKSLSSINFNHNFDTSNVTNMVDMFGGNSNFTTLDLSDFDTHNVTDMSRMFSRWVGDENGGWGKSVLSNIIFGDNFDTSNVTIMEDMFSGTYISSLDLRKFNTYKVTNMFRMFEQCDNLVELNLCSFDTNNVTDARRMFGDSSKLKYIYVGSGWNLSNADSTGILNNAGVSSVTTGKCVS